MVLGGGGESDIDPTSATLPVLESGEAPQMLTGNRCWICAGPRSQPTLNFSPLMFLQGVPGSQPDVATTLWRRMNCERGIGANDAVRHPGGDVIEKEERPAVTPRGPDVDFRPANVFCAHPGQRQLLDLPVVMPEHRSSRPSHRQVRVTDPSAFPPFEHEFGLLSCSHLCLSLSTPRGAVVSGASTSLTCRSRSRFRCR